jgi:hypothetical protein
LSGWSLKEHFFKQDMEVFMAGTTTITTETLSNALNAIKTLIENASEEVKTKLLPQLKAFIAEANGTTAVPSGSTQTISGTDQASFDKNNVNGTDYKFDLTPITEDEIKDLAEKMGDARVQERFAAFVSGVITGLSMA